MKVMIMLKNIPETYQIIGKIGSGKSGEIYKAYHKNLGKYVILKKIKTDIKDFVNNRAEVDVLKNLRHSCLPQVFDFLEVDGNVYTVMDFIPGNSFKQYLDAGRTFPEKSVIVWAKQICATLCYLHNQQPPIIHSDLKPGNIMLMPNGNVCLIDFNISASLDGNTAWVTGCTSGYAAPEQIEALMYNQNELDRRLWKMIDGRADLYSLGATVYHLLSGKKPQTDQNDFVEDIQNTGIKINDVFASIIMKCLEPNLEKRYQNAEDLLADLQNIHKKDRKYKNLIVRQRLIYGLTIFCAVLCAVIAFGGYFQMGTDRQKKYVEMVREETQCIEKENFTDMEIYYQKAIGLLPDRIDAYYQKALALSKQRRYGDCIDFINSEVLSNGKIAEKKEDLNNIYYLLGDSYEKTEDYEMAAQCYKTAIDIFPDASDYYRDYAIMLAYCDRFEEAGQVLEEAKERGLDSLGVQYIEGEILYAQGQYKDAKKIFLDCIEESKDSYLQMRSYIMASKCIDADSDDTEGQLEKISLLEKARANLPKENNIGVLEELGQSYSDLGNKEKNSVYFQDAIDVFVQIENQGMASYETEYNLAVLYQNIQDYAKATEILTRMTDIYGEDYRTYKALSFLEVAKQSKMANDMRNYEKFREYYSKAEELYQEQLLNNINDVEMERLEELYGQAVQNGWIKDNS